MTSHIPAVALATLFVVRGSSPAAPPTGFQTEVKVERPTRLDWEFVAAGFGKDAARLPTSYYSTRQRYQLFVPRVYNDKKSWPLIVFVSPGDAPLGWRYWQKVCEDHNLLFCAAYAAGNNCPAGARVRIVLDMFDQVRRTYRIDPDQTYLTGFSGGGRVACAVAFALPEYCGGVIPVCGTNPLNKLDYLRHRVQDRLSVAFVTGATDFNRAENEKFQFPLLRDLGVRARLWVVPKMGHAVPSAAVLEEVRQWLDADLSRRRADATKRPALACPPEDSLTPARLAARLLEAAESALKEDDRTWHGVTLLQGIVARWPRTESAQKAKKLLAGLNEDARRLRLVEEQGGQEERTVLQAQAQALERFGQAEQAVSVWKELAKQHPDSPEGRKAAAAVRRLGQVLGALPYLGVGFAGQSAVVEQVVAGGPADRAGVRPGDRFRTLEGKKVPNLEGLQRALQSVKPGDKVKLEVDRRGKALTLTVQVGARPS